ncbi:MAG: hypothetical protein V3U53_00295 [bacterium]
MPPTNVKNDIVFGALLLGVTGVLIGLVIHSGLAMAVAGVLGVIIGSLVGWIGGRWFLLTICFGALAGAVIGYRTGDRDILIIAAGSGAAISGFVGAQVELFIRKR